MDITLSVDDEVVHIARRRAESMGTSLDQLVRDYLERFAKKSDPNRDADEFEQLSRLSQGNSKGWKFDRDEVHERR